jgi:hypothetical protein
LGDEEAVERIPVVQGKAVQGIDMLEGDRQDPETVHYLLLLEQDAQWLGKCQLAELDLDLNFPAVDNAESYVVAQIAESPIDCFRQTRRLVMPPQWTCSHEGVHMWEEISPHLPKSFNACKINGQGESFLKIW